MDSWAYLQHHMEVEGYRTPSMVSQVLVPLNLHVMWEVCPRINTVPLMDFLMARTVSFPTHQLVPRKLTGHALTSMALFGVLELAAASMLPCLLPRWTQNF